MLIELRHLNDEITVFKSVRVYSRKNNTIIVDKMELSEEEIKEIKLDGETIFRRGV